MSEQQATPDVFYRFQGPDRFPGIPARDLTEADYDALSIDQKRDVIASTSYEALVDVPDQPNPTEVPIDLSKLSRAELEEYAATAGVVDPESYPNMALLIEAIQTQKDGE